MAINEFSKKYLIEVKLNLPLLSLIMYTNHYKIQYTIVCFKSIGERLQGNALNTVSVTEAVVRSEHVPWRFE